MQITTARQARANQIGHVRRLDANPERDIARAGQRLGALDYVLRDAEPVGRDQEQGALRLDAVVVDKLATAGEAGHGIFDCFDFHLALRQYQMSHAALKQMLHCEAKAHPHLKCFAIA